MTDPMADNELRELQKRYQELTGRKSVSKTLRYLRAQVLELEARKAAGEETKRTGGDARFNVSMSDGAAVAVDKIAKKLDMKRSAFTRMCIADWAERNGHADKAKVIRE